LFGGSSSSFGAGTPSTFAGGASTGVEKVCMCGCGCGCVRVRGCGCGCVCARAAQVLIHNFLSFLIMNYMCVPLLAARTAPALCSAHAWQSQCTHTRILIMQVCQSNDPPPLSLVFPLLRLLAAQTAPALCSAHAWRSQCTRASCTPVCSSEPQHRR
jgi:hypothetical protein